MKSEQNEEGIHLAGWLRLVSEDEKDEEGIHMGWGAGHWYGMLEHQWGEEDAHKESELVWGGRA